MKKNYTTNSKKIRNYFYLSGVIGFAAILTGFGPMFFGPGLTNPEPFDPWTDTAFTPTGTSTDPYEVAFPNLTFDSPITFSPVPNQTKIVVGQLDGKVFWIGADNNTTIKQQIMDFSAEVGDRNEGQVWDGGFLGLAIHPEFGTTPGKNYFFIYYTTASANPTLGGPQGFSCNVETFSDNYLKLERFEVDPVSMAFVANSRVTMINRRLYNTTHRGGGMEFGDDGFLYLSTGDQAAYINAQELDENLDGGVLRLDVDMIGGATSHAPIRTLSSPGAGDFDEFSGEYYFIPNDNPFPSPTGDTFEEYYSIGHRNPHRMTKDRGTGTFYIGEVGENTHEEINVVGSGNNYGWPLFEANAPFNPGCAVSLYPGTTHQPPLTQFVRSEASSIIGGYVYRGSNMPELVGKYVAADYAQNTIWQIDTGTGEKQLLGNFDPTQVISFGQDVQGELYFLKLGNNVPLYRMKSSIAQASAPSTLSATGVFTDVQNLVVADGFIPYEMIDPFWSDGAYKTRWMAIPNDGSHNTAAEQIQWSENGDWGFPIGSILVKHFDYPIDDNDPSVTRKIETRFSIKSTDGNFYFLTYKWRPDESDADLVDMTTGDTATIPVTTVGGGSRNVNWLYPSNTQCITCHNPALGGTLGPRTRSLNKDFDYEEKGGTVGNQLVTLSTLGILNHTITDTDTPGYLTHKSINDLNATLDEKARTYLDNNCAYCHQPATGNRADFDLRLFKTLSQTGLLTAGINQTIPALGADQEIVFVGDASKSQLHYRVNSLDPGIMMPPLAKGIVDTEGVALLEAWINQLQPPAPAPADGTYRLVNYATKATLQVADASTDDGVNVQQEGYEGLDYQHWAFEASPELGYYYFQAESSGKFLDVAGFGPNIGVNVWQYTGNASDAQKWEVIDAGDDTFNIISKAYGNYLGVEPNGNVVVGTNDQNSDIFRWEFLPTSAPFVRGIAVQTNTVVTSEDETTEDIELSLKSAPASDVTLQVSVTGAADEVTLSVTELTFTAANWNTPQIVTVTGVDDAFVDGNQEYSVQIAVDVSLSDIDYAGFVETITGINEDNDGGAGAPPTPGIYRIVNVGSGLSAQVLNAGTANSVNIQQGLYQGDGHQQFDLVYRENGLYSLEAVHSGKVMDVEFGNSDPGTNVWQYTYDGSTPQLWTIQDGGNGTYQIISDLGGHYLTIDANGNILVDIENGSDDFKWVFDEIGPGITVSEGILLTEEDGDTDTFTVVLKEAPTAPVNIGLQVIEGIGEISLDLDQLIFDANTWNVPQTVTVTSIDDMDQDGAQDFVVEAVVVAPFNDANYDSGIGDMISGISYDNDGGENGPPAPGIYRLRNVGNTESAMPANGTVASTTNAVTGAYGNESYQHFELILEETGYFSIKAIDGNFVMDVQNGSTDPGANIWMYTYTGTNNVSQEWDIEGAGNGTFRIKSVINPANDYYMMAGPTDSNITVNEDDGSDYFKWEFLPTGYPPEAISSSDIIAGNEPLTVQFTGSLSTDDKNDIISYSWDFGNGDTSTEADPSYTFTNGGNYQVLLTVTDGDGYTDDSEIITINVNAGPTAVASADVLEGNASLDVIFTGDQSTDDIGITSYSWDFGDGTTSILPNPAHTFATADVYTVTLTVTDDGGLEDTDTITITVSDPNGAPIAVATSDISEGTAPLEVSFTGDQSTDDVGISTYSWDFGDGSLSSDMNPIHTFIGEGIYQVVLTVADANGLEDTDTITITVNLPTNMAPVAVATSSISSGEVPLEVSFTGDQSTDDIGIATYSWDFGDGTTSNLPNPVHTFTTADVYMVTLTVTDDEGLEDTDTITITASNSNEAPIAVATSDISEGTAPLEVSFTGDQSTDDVGIVTYNWDFGDGNTSADVNPIYTFTEIGEYAVILTVIDEGGLQSTDQITITVSKENVAQEEPDFEFVLAPNPTTNYVDVVMSENFDLDQILGVMLHDMSGRLIRQFMVDEVLEGTVLRLPTSTYRNEVYVVTVMFANNEPVSKRLVIN